MDKPEKRLKTQITFSVVVLLAIMAIFGTMFTTNLYADDLQDQETETKNNKSEMSGGLKFGLIAAAIAFGLGALSAGFAISHVGAAAMGAIAEKPQIAGQALIFVALAEGIVVFGFITALMILGKV